MAHEIEWIEEPWIMKVRYWERMTTDDIETVMKRCLEVADEHPINFWVDLSDLKFHDPRLFRSVALARLLRHHNTKWFAFTGLTGMLELSAKLLLRLASFRIFSDGEAAVAFLRDRAEEQKASVDAVPSEDLIR
jgi:hypothetical protein